MNVRVLIENSLCQNPVKGIKTQHGLSLYIEALGKKILFDVGKTDLFIKNAERMDIRLEEVDYLVISHGHSDHGGGLEYFLQINDRAQVYMHQQAADRYYTKIFGILPYYIGLSQKTLSQNKERIHFLGEDREIFEGISILENIPGDFPRPSGNNSLYVKGPRHLIHDDFRHELILVIKEEDGTSVFTGCSHSGLINMVKRVQNAYPLEKIKAVLGGFHLYNPVTKKDEDGAYVDLLTAELDYIDAYFYTGHCTGEKSFNRMKAVLKDKVEPMNTGDLLKI